MNLVNMVNKFENETWYQIDMIMNWDDRTATIYIDSQQLASSVFFTDKKAYKPTSANAIFLYNLAPSTTCSIRNLQVCSGRCPGKRVSLIDYRWREIRVRVWKVFGCLNYGDSCNCFSSILSNNILWN